MEAGVSDHEHGYISRLDQHIEKAKVEVAKSAIASPQIYPQWDRLRAAKRNLIDAYRELNEAQQAWDNLIAATPAEWRAPAPVAE